MAFRDLAPPKDAPDDDGRWLAHISALYGVEYTLLNVASSLGAVAASVVGLFIVQLPPTCGTGSASGTCLEDWELAAIPIAPVLVVLFFGYLFFSARVIGKYTRHLERWQEGLGRARTGPALEQSAESDATKEALLAPPALSRLNGALFGGETTRLLPLRIFYLLFAGTVVGLGVVTLFVVLGRIDSDGLRAAAFVAYGLLAGLMLWMYVYGASHVTYESLLEAVLIREARNDEDREPQLPWGRYLGFVAIPRPLSLVGKGQDGVWVIVAGAMLAGLVTVGWNGFARALVLLAAFELLLYQTRYLWNATRDDPVADRELPADRRSRPALPFTATQRVLSPFFGLARIALFAAASISLGVPVQTAAVVVGAFLVAFYAYEIPREKARQHAAESNGLVARTDSQQTGDERVSQESGSVAALSGTPPTVPHSAPGPDHEPAPVPSLADLDRPALSRFMFVAVGAGYALRAAFCLYAVSPSIVGSSVGVMIVLSFYASGCAGVSAGWAREFTGALSAHGSAVHVNAVSKPALYWAAKHVGLVPTRVQFGVFSAGDSQESRRVELYEYPANPASPWRLATVLATTLIGAVLATEYSAVVLVPTATVVLAVLLTWPFRPETTRRDVTLAAAILGSLAALACVPAGSSYAAAAACALLWVRHLLRLRAAEDGSLSELVEAALKFWATTGHKLGHALKGGCGLLFGQAWIDAVNSRVSHSSGITPRPNQQEMP